MIKWVVSDMDGTLLNSKDQITYRTKAALIRFQELGGKVVLASGRSYTRLLPYAEELQLKKYKGFLIEVNGMALYDLETDHRKIIRRFNREEIREIFLFCKGLGAEIQCFQDQAVYYMIPPWQRQKKEQERIRRRLPENYPNLGGAWGWIADTTDGYPFQKEITSVEEIPDELNKINCVADARTNKWIYEKIKSHFCGKYEIVRTCPRLIEISPQGVTKGNVLEQLMKKENIRRDEVLVFGDGENDVEMFKKVKYSFAMENAEEFIKENAYAITSDNEHDGVASILEKYERNYK